MPPRAIRSPGRSTRSAEPGPCGKQAVWLPGCNESMHLTPEAASLAGRKRAGPQRGGGNGQWGPVVRHVRRDGRRAAALARPSAARCRTRGDVIAVVRRRCATMRARAGCVRCALEGARGTRGGASRRARAAPWAPGVGRRHPWGGRTRARAQRRGRGGAEGRVRGAGGRGRGRRAAYGEAAVGRSGRRRTRREPPAGAHTAARRRRPAPLSRSGSCSSPVRISEGERTPEKAGTAVLRPPQLSHFPASPLNPVARTRPGTWNASREGHSHRRYSPRQRFSPTPWGRPVRKAARCRTANAQSGALTGVGKPTSAT